MDIDPRFPTKLNSVDDAPEPFRGALADHIPSGESILLLVHAPAFSTVNETLPATVLAITHNGWLVASEAEDGGAAVEKSNFTDTLFLELTSILLWGQFKIHFASVGTAYSVTITFDTVEENVYHEATELRLNGIDPTRASSSEDERTAVSIPEDWPLKFRAEAKRYLPKGERLLATVSWPAISGGFEREIVPAGALLVTRRELVLISEEKTSPRQYAGDLHTFGAIVTYFPSARLGDFRVGHHERFGVLTLQAHARHGGEKLEIIFPADHEKAVSKAMEQVEFARETPTVVH
jgi:hypothetical protein